MKRQNLKEIAKFLSGLTAWEALVHLSIQLSDILPIKFFGINITTNVNAIQIIVPATISILLASFAWIKN